MSISVNIVPVIMSGGAGTRLWPLSTREKPKQLHALNSQLTLLQETLLRCPQTKGFAAPIVVCAERHGKQIKAQCEAVNTAPASIITEPCPRNTAPCAVSAALAVQRHYGDDAQILLLAADHYMADRQAFVDAVRAGAAAAAQGHIVTFGAKPNHPATGYGYIRRGAAIDGVAFNVDSFVEKPDLATAKTYLADQNYVWNAGIFLFRADVMLAEMATHRPDIMRHAAAAWHEAREDGIFQHLAEESFAKCPGESLDYAVMENTKCAAIVPLGAGWSDIGSWPALHELMTKDAHGNAIHGRVIMNKARDCLLHADGPMIAAYGVENLAIITTKKAVLVMPLAEAQNLKALIENLEEDER